MSRYFHKIFRESKEEGDDLKIASNPLADPEHLQNVFNKHKTNPDSEHILAKLASNPNIHPEILKKLGSYGSEKIMKSAMKNPIHHLLSIEDPNQTIAQHLVRSYHDYAQNIPPGKIKNQGLHTVYKDLRDNLPNDIRNFYIVDSNHESFGNKHKAMNELLKSGDFDKHKVDLNGLFSKMRPSKDNRKLLQVIARHPKTSIKSLISVSSQFPELVSRHEKIQNIGSHMEIKANTPFLDKEENMHDLFQLSYGLGSLHNDDTSKFDVDNLLLDHLHDESNDKMSRSSKIKLGSQFLPYKNTHPEIISRHIRATKQFADKNPEYKDTLLQNLSREFKSYDSLHKNHPEVKNLP